MNKDADLNMEQKILDVAVELFLNNGFDKTSTTEIAKKVGCNQALIHYYFRTKENLFQKVFESKFKSFASVFLALKKPEADFIENLRNMISAHFEILAEHPKFPFLILFDMLYDKKRIALLKESIGNIPQGIFAIIGNDLEAEIAKGNIRRISAMDLLLNIISLNAFLFASLPLFSEILGISEEQKKHLIEHRKQEIIETIIGSLKP